MHRLRKSLILIHRYLGIALGLLFVVWFVSGIAMIYARGMPTLTPETRFERAPAIDFSRVRLTPAEAAARREGGEEGVGRVVVSTVLHRPVYRLGGRGGTSIVYADDGSRLEEVDAEMAKAIAGQFAGLSADVHAEKIHYSLVTEADQWTIGQRRQMPLHKVSIDDGNGTELYISPNNGDILVMTTRGSRALAWVAAIPHWLYFKSLRVNDALWSKVIIYTSGVGCVLAVLGIVLGFTQYRRSRPHIPYAGMMRWHYITGAVFGLFTLTWVFSGLLSMDPWEWVSGEDLTVGREPFSGGSIQLDQYPAFDAYAWSRLVQERPLKEIELLRIAGDPYYVARDAAQKRFLVSANPLEVRQEPFDSNSLRQRLEKAAPGAKIVDFQVLDEYDSYYYARFDDRPLPMIRAKFDDPKETWVYIDPMMGQVAGQIHRGDRIQRWLYKGFHSLDFSFWYYSPAWDAGMILLNLGGAAVSFLGLWLGARRMIRGTKRALRPSSPVAAERISGD